MANKSDGTLVPSVYLFGTVRLGIYSQDGLFRPSLLQKNGQFRRSIKGILHLFTALMVPNYILYFHPAARLSSFDHAGPHHLKRRDTLLLYPASHVIKNSLSLQIVMQIVAAPVPKFECAKAI